MAGNSTTHWTDDDELVSKFVLHQLSPPETERLSSHLPTCERCRESVRKETLLAARMKQAGRAALKERLKSRLASNQQRATLSSPIPWIKIVGVAATVVFIIAVGVYYNWLGPDYRANRSITEETTREQVQPLSDTTRILQDKALSKGVSQEDKEVPLSTGLLERERSKQLARRPASNRNEVQNSQEFAGKEEAKTTGGAQSNPQGYAESAPKMAMKKEEVQLSDQAISTPARGSWVTGYVVHETPARDDLRKMFSGSRAYSLNSPSNQVSAKKDILRGGRGTESDVGVRVPISLRQEPASSIPSEVQATQVQPGTIQTLVEGMDNGIQVTLFLDSPVPDSVLKAAEISIVDADSLTIKLPGQSIGLTLPPGFTEKGKFEHKEVK